MQTGPAPLGLGRGRRLLSPRVDFSHMALMEARVKIIQKLPDKGCCGLGRATPRAYSLNSAASRGLHPFFLGKCSKLFFTVAKCSCCAQQDYSWEDHGFSLVNRLYSDIGHLLDEKFRMVDGLQSSAMAKRQGCEPSVFKRGIWNYIHCMFGIR